MAASWKTIQQKSQWYTSSRDIKGVIKSSLVKLTRHIRELVPICAESDTHAASGCKSPLVPLTCRRRLPPLLLRDPIGTQDSMDRLRKEVGTLCSDPDKLLSLVTLAPSASSADPLLFISVVLTPHWPFPSPTVSRRLPEPDSNLFSGPFSKLASLLCSVILLVLKSPLVSAASFKKKFDSDFICIAQKLD